MYSIHRMNISRSWKQSQLWQIQWYNKTNVTMENNKLKRCSWIFRQTSAFPAYIARAVFRSGGKKPWLRKTKRRMWVQNTKSLSSLTGKLTRRIFCGPRTWETARPGSTLSRRTKTGMAWKTDAKLHSEHCWSVRCSFFPRSSQLQDSTGILKRPLSVGRN